MAVIGVAKYIRQKRKERTDKKEKGGRNGMIGILFTE